MSTAVKSASETQRDSDIIVLTAAIHGVKMQIGAERFAAAQAGLPRQLQRKTLEDAAAAAAHSATEQHPNTSGTEEASFDSTLALARAAGIGRFGARQEGNSAAEADATGDTLALMRQAGVGRYSQ